MKIVLFLTLFFISILYGFSQTSVLPELKEKNKIEQFKDSFTYQQFLEKSGKILPADSLNLLINPRELYLNLGELTYEKDILSNSNSKGMLLYEPKGSYTIRISEIDSTFRSKMTLKKLGNH